MCLSPEGPRSLRGLALPRKCAPGRGQAGSATQRPFQAAEAADPGGRGLRPTSGSPPSLPAPCFSPPRVLEAPGPPGFVLFINAFLRKPLKKGASVCGSPPPAAPSLAHSRHSVRHSHATEDVLGSRTPCQVLIFGTWSPSLGALVSRWATGRVATVQKKTRGPLHKKRGDSPGNSPSQAHGG